MNKFKKIGLTALAASLVSVSANAGELTISGAASLGIGGYSGSQYDAGTTFSMGNQVTLTGSGELDNGLTVSISYQMDENEESGAGGPFDDHSLTISSDTMGSLTFSGHGAGSATSAMDATAAGNIWDTFDGSLGQVTGVGHSNSASGDNSFNYVAPTIMEGVKIDLSYAPQAAGNTIDSGMGYAVTYTGVEGLTLAYSNSDIVGTTSDLSGDQTAWKVSYAYGPITATMTQSEYDVVTTTSDQEVSSYAVSYTINDEMSVTYGTDTIESTSSGDVDAEYTVLSGSYTAGGMTISANIKEGENIDHSTNANADFEYWGLGLAFAF